MEGITWLTHKYVMHGFLWVLHKDHHQPHDHDLEKNDLFAIIFAVPCITLFYFGTFHDNPWLTCIAIGVFLYGIAYFLVHDVVIHQRIKWWTHSKNKYVRAMRWAHKMHHKHLGKEDGESFGFLWVERKYRDKIKKDESIRRAGSA
ncbi:sterol desaturase family protein [Membranihabitans maritimus]|uniref:sterol desaturase family protein n=1 Tax=Membranihabitans maritimus TaxID=2904244 RepID=UPI001F2A43C6